MRLVPVLTLEANNQSNNECLPKFVQTDNASSSIKPAIARTFRYSRYNQTEVIVIKETIEFTIFFLIFNLIKGWTVKPFLNSTNR